MPTGSHYETAIVGGGLVGLATARAMVEAGLRSLVVLEAEDAPARHQSGHNSGVIHSGLYYRPGSMKARSCVEGREAMYRFCAEAGIPHERCGKVVTATCASERPFLDELEQRGRANGLQGLRRLDPVALRELEPHAAGLDALWVPDTGIVDFSGVAAALVERLKESGIPVLTGHRVCAVRKQQGGFLLEGSGQALRVAHIVNCAGLQADRVARMCGLDPGLQIIPFRGEYYALKPEREHLVRNLIYPVPDPRFPFLGVHFTRMVKGGVEAGPNAVLAWKREGYRHRDVSPRDLASMLGYAGFWRMAARHGRTGCAEWRRSLSKRAFVAALRRLVPEVRPEDVVRHGAGVRAQAVAPDGRLLDDFRILEAPGMLHVLNAPSPAATASLNIGRVLAASARRVFAA